MVDSGLAPSTSERSQLKDEAEFRARLLEERLSLRLNLLQLTLGASSSLVREAKQGYPATVDSHFISETFNFG